MMEYGTCNKAGGVRTHTMYCSIILMFPSISLSSSSIPPYLQPVPQSWDVFFRNANAGAPPGAAYQSPLGLSEAPQLSSLVGAQPNVEKLVEDHLAVQSLIRAYQVDAQCPPHTAAVLNV